MVTSSRLQVTYVDAAIGRQAVISIFLVNGVRLSGRILSEDNFTILLIDGDRVALIYKHAVSTLLSLQDLPLGSPEEGAAPAGPRKSATKPPAAKRR